MTFTVNGIPLDNDTYGWALHDKTVLRMGFQHEMVRSRRAGRDGVAVAPSTRDPVVLRIVVSAPDSTRQQLLALFSQQRLTLADGSGRTADARLASVSPDDYHGHLAWGQDAFLVEIPAGCWRSVVATSALTPATALGATATLYPGLSAPVQDAVVRFKGPLQDPQVTDPSGAFVALDGTVAAGQFVRFESDTGRAWLTTTDTWAGGTEVSGLIDFGGPRGVFEITPNFPTAADPSIRDGRLTLTQATYNTGSGFQVRGAAAYLL